MSNTGYYVIKGRFWPPTPYLINLNYFRYLHARTRVIKNTCTPYFLLTSPPPPPPPLQETKQIVCAQAKFLHRQPSCLPGGMVVILQIIGVVAL